MIAETLLVIAGSVLNILVLPTLVDSSAKVPRLQSLPSAMSLLVMTMAYVLLGMFLPALVTLVGAGMWFAVAKYRS